MLKLKSGESEYISKGERSWNTFDLQSVSIIAIFVVFYITFYAA